MPQTPGGIESGHHIIAYLEINACEEQAGELTSKKTQNTPVIRREELGSQAHEMSGTRVELLLRVFQGKNIHKGLNAEGQRTQFQSCRALHLNVIRPEEADADREGIKTQRMRMKEGCPGEDAAHVRVGFRKSGTGKRSPTIGCLGIDELNPCPLLENKVILSGSEIPLALTWYKGGSQTDSHTSMFIVRPNLFVLAGAWTLVIATSDSEAAANPDTLITIPGMGEDAHRATTGRKREAKKKADAYGNRDSWQSVDVVDGMTQTAALKEKPESHSTDIGYRYCSVLNAVCVGYCMKTKTALDELKVEDGRRFVVVHRAEDEHRAENEHRARNGIRPIRVPVLVRASRNRETTFTLQAYRYGGYQGAEDGHAETARCAAARSVSQRNRCWLSAFAGTHWKFERGAAGWRAGRVMSGMWTPERWGEHAGDTRRMQCAQHMSAFRARRAVMLRAETRVTFIPRADEVAKAISMTSAWYQKSEVRKPESTRGKL
ncbi:hypothetical protein DFH09DRAFT_1392882 [Mycena vulgaris]|nr:hypothetical protein DFH09DRAFT_1392882 [Mycena vulgaris]